MSLRRNTLSKDRPQSFLNIGFSVHSLHHFTEWNLSLNDDAPTHKAENLLPQINNSQRTNKQVFVPLIPKKSPEKRKKPVRLKINPSTIGNKVSKYIVSSSSAPRGLDIPLNEEVDQEHDDLRTVLPDISAWDKDPLNSIGSPVFDNSKDTSEMPVISKFSIRLEKDKLSNSTKNSHKPKKRKFLHELPQKKRVMRRKFKNSERSPFHSRQVKSSVSVQIEGCTDQVTDFFFFENNGLCIGYAGNYYGLSKHWNGSNPKSKKRPLARRMFVKFHHDRRGNILSTAWAQRHRLGQSTQIELTSIPILTGRSISTPTLFDSVYNDDIPHTCFSEDGGHMHFIKRNRKNVFGGVLNESNNYANTFTQRSNESGDLYLARPFSRSVSDCVGISMSANEEGLYAATAENGVYRIPFSTMVAEHVDCGIRRQLCCFTGIPNGSRMLAGCVAYRNTSQVVLLNDTLEILSRIDLRGDIKCIEFHQSSNFFAVGTAFALYICQFPTGLILSTIENPHGLCASRVHFGEYGSHSWVGISFVGIAVVQLHSIDLGSDYDYLLGKQFSYQPQRSHRCVRIVSTSSEPAPRPKTGKKRRRPKTGGSVDDTSFAFVKRGNQTFFVDGDTHIGPVKFALNRDRTAGFFTCKKQLYRWSAQYGVDGTVVKLPRHPVKAIKLINNTVIISTGVNNTFMAYCGDSMEIIVATNVESLFDTIKYVVHGYKIWFFIGVNTSLIRFGKTRTSVSGINIPDEDVEGIRFHPSGMAAFYPNKFIFPYSANNSDFQTLKAKFLKSGARYSDYLDTIIQHMGKELHSDGIRKLIFAERFFDMAVNEVSSANNALVDDTNTQLQNMEAMMGLIEINDRSNEGIINIFTAITDDFLDVCELFEEAQISHVEVKLLTTLLDPQGVYTSSESTFADACDTAQRLVAFHDRTCNILSVRSNGLLKHFSNMVDEAISQLNSNVAHHYAKNFERVTLRNKLVIHAFDLVSNNEKTLHLLSTKGVSLSDSDLYVKGLKFNFRSLEQIILDLYSHKPVNARVISHKHFTLPKPVEELSLVFNEVSKALTITKEFSEEMKPFPFFYSVANSMEKSLEQNAKLYSNLFDRLTSCCSMDRIGIVFHNMPHVEQLIVSSRLFLNGSLVYYDDDYHEKLKYYDLNCFFVDKETLSPQEYENTLKRIHTLASSAIRVIFVVDQDDCCKPYLKFVIIHGNLTE
ncbi:hypothetical protein PCE1_000117 [Barthelona sp. PCE]